MSRTRLGLIVCVGAVMLLAACSGGGQPDVQATVQAAIAATSEAQTALQSTVAAAVAATQAAQAPAAATAEVLTTTPAPPSTTSLATVAALTATPETPVATPTSPAPACTVVTDRLNLRSGPGTVFPALATLPAGSALQPVSFMARGFPSGSWIEVQRPADGMRGWVSAGQQFVACNFDPATLPAGVSPPTPTPRPPTATPTPVNTVAVAPTRIQVANIVPVDGSDGNRSLGNDRGVNGGRNILLPGPGSIAGDGTVVFRDSVVFQVEVFDRNVGQYDGAGIRDVTFKISDGTGNVVHQRTEYNAGYCVFGGGEPTCTVWRFSEHGGRWPGGAALRYGDHSVQIDIVPQNGQGVTWFWRFRIANP